MGKFGRNQRLYDGNCPARYDYRTPEEEDKEGRRRTRYKFKHKRGTTTRGNFFGEPGTLPWKDTIRFKKGEVSTLELARYMLKRQQLEAPKKKRAA